MPSNELELAVKLDSAGVFCDAVLRVICKRLAKDEKESFVVTDMM